MNKIHANRSESPLKGSTLDTLTPPIPSKEKADAIASPCTSDKADECCQKKGNALSENDGHHTKKDLK